MTRQNNTRLKVVFLADQVLSTIGISKLAFDINQANRPSSLTQSQEKFPNFDRIEAPLRSDEGNDEKQLHPKATSLPTHIAANNLYLIKTKAPYPTITRSTETAFEAIFFFKGSDSVKHTWLTDWWETSFFRLTKQLPTISLFEAFGNSYF